MKNVAEPLFSACNPALELGRVVIFVAGTGNPYFSTDTTAALRAERDSRRRDSEKRRNGRHLRSRSEGRSAAKRFEQAHLFPKH